MTAFIKVAAIGLSTFVITKLHSHGFTNSKRKKALAFNKEYDHIPPKEAGRKVNFYNFICISTNKEEEQKIKSRMDALGDFLVDRNFCNYVKEINVTSDDISIECGHLLSKRVQDQVGIKLPVKTKPELVAGVPAKAIPSDCKQMLLERHVHIDEARFDFIFANNIKKPDQRNECDERNQNLYLCSSNVIRYIVCRALQVSPNAYNRFSVMPGSITSIACYENGDVKLLYLNDSSASVTNTNMSRC